MKLKLNLSGTVDPFAGYLKNYARIRDSLLLEIDTNAKAFVAKTFTEDRSSVRFSSITFESANMTVVSDDGETQRGGARIKTAILIQLPKFIKMFERFGADVDEKGVANFDIIIDYDVLQNGEETDYVSTSVSFKSETLKMKIDGFRISEFKYLSDETFANVVFNVSDPVTFLMPASTISAIIKTSEIIKIDPRKDVLIFYVDGKNVYVKDQAFSSKNKEPNFVYKVGTLENEPSYEISAKISREKFITMMDKVNEPFNVILGRSQRGGDLCVNRILFDAVDSETKVVISTVSE